MIKPKIYKGVNQKGNMANKSVLLFSLLFMFILSFSMVSAQYTGDFSQQGAEYFDSGLVINVIYPHESQINENLTLFGSVYGMDGKLKDIDDVECVMGLISPHGDRLLLVNETDFETQYDDRIIIATIPSTFLYETGNYLFNADCEESIKGGYFSGQITVIEADEHDGLSNGLIIFLALIPIIISLLFILGSAFLSEQHSILRMVSYFMVLPLSWVSFHFGMLGLVKYEALAELQIAIGSTVYWTGWVFFALISYIIIYLIYVAFQTAAQKKKARLEY